MVFVAAKSAPPHLMVCYCTSTDISRFAVAVLLEPAAAVVCTLIIHVVLAGSVMYPVVAGVFQVVPVVL